MRCITARDFNVAKALAWRSAIDESAPYQREGAVWSVDRQQLFMDSLLNGYDVPKIYLHDLRGTHPTKVYTIVDGKQRLTTIWRFLGDAFTLAPDFRIIEENLPDLPPGTRHPRAGDRYSDLAPEWQRVLRATTLSVVLIRNATIDDIEDVFSRLNNGEPLNAPEKRNAIGGAMAQLTKELARNAFFTDCLPFGNDRYQHLDLAAKVLLIEQVQHRAPGTIPDLRAPALDEFVRMHRQMDPDDGERLKEWALVPLSFLSRVFRADDPLLARPASPLLYYLAVKQLRRDRRDLSSSDIRCALDAFEAARQAELERPDGERDASLVEFWYLTEHGTNDSGSLERRREILLRHVA